jgi:GrpB-like predicted nucleotidyltransferase (UPF0157 family)
MKDTLLIIAGIYGFLFAAFHLCFWRLFLWQTELARVSAINRGVMQVLNLCLIHHIGSTAVPGLAAKPIIDILMEVTALEELDALNQRMESIGYTPKGEFGIPGRRYFQKGGDDRTHHLHAFARGDFNLARHLAFRDYLRGHPEVAREYGELKRAVAKTCENDIGRYCDGKDAFVKDIESIAIGEKASIAGHGG